MGLLVTAYGVGQIFGPIGSGIMMEITDQADIALWVAATLSLAGGGLLFGAKNLQHTSTQDTTIQGREQLCRS